MPDALTAEELVGAVERVAGLAHAGRADLGLPQGRALLARLEGGAAPPDEMRSAQALNVLGQFFMGHEFADEAQRAYTLGLGIVERVAPQDWSSLATLRNNLGQAEHRLGRREAARALLEDSLALKLQGPDTPLNIAYTRDNLALVLGELGETERAEQLHLEALEVFEREQGPKSADLATALGSLGKLCARQGQTARARACLLRSLDIHLQTDGIEGQNTRVTVAHLVGLCLEQHDHRLAGELADIVLPIGGDAPDARHHGAAVAMLELARRAFEAFSLGLAERLAARAMVLLEASEGPGSPNELAATRLLANVHAAKGNPAAAEALLMQALEVSEASGHDRAQTLVDFGKALRQRGRSSFGAAATMFEHALRLLRGSPERDPTLLASALGNLGALRFENDEPQAADALYGEALAAIGDDPGRHDLPWLLHQRAMLHYHLGRHDEALPGYLRARKLWHQRLGARHPFVATTEANLALLHWARGDAAAAAKSFALAHRLRAPELARLLAVGSERERADAARDQIDDLYKLVSFHLSAGVAAEAAATTLIQRKGSVLDAVAQSQARLRSRLTPASRRLLDQLADTDRRIADQIAAEHAERGADARAVATLQSQSDRLQAELARRSAFGQWALTPPTLTAVRAALPTGAILVEYLRHPVFDPVRTGAQRSWQAPRYAAMVLRRRGAPQWVDLGDAQVIDAAASDLRHRLSDPGADGLDEAAQALGALIVAPIEAWLGNPRLLLIAPDGALNLVPFGVLGDPPLAERCAISHLVGGRELLRPDDDTEPTSPPQAIVDPDFDASPDDAEPSATDAAAATAIDEGYARLPGTLAEAQALQALWPRTRVLAGAQASAQALRRVERPALLHIATHGHFTSPDAQARAWDSRTLLVDDQLYFLQRAAPSARSDAMLHGGLALAGANRGTPAQAVGIVGAAELARLDLRGTALAVLSACDSGLGQAAQGEEFAGLRRAFAIAGARAQVTSLWAVDDRATAALMDAYYRRLRDGVGRAEALRQAQASLRARPRWAHPAYWAAFVAWGDPRPLPKALREPGSAP